MSESINYLEKNRRAIRYHDQDMLNCLFFDRCKFIDLRWNVNSDIYAANKLSHFYTKSEADIARKNPAIIHYTCPWSKHWKYYILHQLSGEYFKYRKYTDFELSILDKIYLFFYELAFLELF